MPVNYKEVFPKRMKEVRMSRGLRQDELADKLGIARSNIANYETGRNFPLTEVLLHIADYLKTSIDYLLGLTHDPEPLGDRGHLNISIDNLEDLPLSYNGVELTPEQRQYVGTLVKSALSLQENSD